MDRLNELAKRNVGNLDRLFSTLEHLHGDTLAVNLDLLHEYAEITKLLDDFSNQTDEQKEMIAYRALALAQRVKFLINSLYGSLTHRSETIH